MGSIIFIIILAVVGLGLIVGSVALRKNDYIGGSVGTLIAGIISLIFAAVILIMSTFYQNSIGQAKVIVNSVDRTIQGTVDEPGAGWKSPLDDFVEFDLFSQQVSFVGGDTAPSYAGGSITGKEITVNVGGINGGSTRANVDLVATYSLGTSDITKIYSEFRSQELFTEQVIQKQVLSIARQIPAQYSAVDFRGTKRGEAELAIQAALNEKLAKYGVEFTTVTLQDIRYPENVETALNAIEEANQAAQKAEAEKATAQVLAEKSLIEAQGKATADIEKARGEAEANRLLSESLTPQVLEQRKIEALTKAAENDNLIIDGSGAGVLLQK